jgi:hypothetical protein
LAKALQQAVKAMMTTEEEQQGGKKQPVTAYHWAAFTLNGMWEWPVSKRMFRNVTPEGLQGKCMTFPESILF